MTIDEAIENLKYDIEIDMYIRDIAPQLAEWLEELRELRVTVSELQCEMQATGALLNERDKETRNKAIDDFAELIHEKLHIYDTIDDLAKQLKAG